MQSFAYLSAPLLGALLSLPALSHDGPHEGARSKSLASGGAQYPLLVVDGDLELRLDNYFASEDWANRRWDLNFHGETLIGFYLNDRLSLQLRPKAEAVREPRDGRNRFLSGTGAFLEELYVDYQAERFGLYAGKFNPAFGLAWKKFGELLKEGFAEEYETTEMNGFGGSLKFDLGAAGKHEFNAALFTADTSILHRSLFARPQAWEERAERISHLRRRDGGLANSGALNSLALALDGGDIDFAPGLSYHLGWRRLHRGRDNFHSENALAFALAYSGDFNGVTVAPFFELVRFWNMEGERGNGYSLSAGLTAEFGRWTWQGGVTLRRQNVAANDGPDLKDWMAGAQLAYALGGGWGIGVGYRHQRVERVDTDQARLFLTYKFDWQHSFAP